MKIKCPLCDKEYFAIFAHLRIEHNNQEVALMFGCLLVKIHEKIEFWGARHPMVVKEFESLLENK